MAFTFAAVFVAAIAAVSSQAAVPAKYPAGVSPAACPNYPFCDVNVDPTTGYLNSYASAAVVTNAVVKSAETPAATVPAPAQFYSAPAGFGYYNWNPYNFYGYNAYPYAYAAAPAVAAAVPATADKYPAGVNPAECPNFPYCHDGANGNFAVGTFKSAYTGVAPLPAAAKYPAGVSPASCPNYPFCS